MIYIIFDQTIEVSRIYFLRLLLKLPGVGVSLFFTLTLHGGGGNQSVALAASSRKVDHARKLLSSALRGL